MGPGKSHRFRLNVWSLILRPVSQSLAKTLFSFLKGEYILMHIMNVVRMQWSI